MDFVKRLFILVVSLALTGALYAAVWFAFEPTVFQLAIFIALMELWGYRQVQLQKGLKEVELMADLHSINDSARNTRRHLTLVFALNDVKDKLDRLINPPSRSTAYEEDVDLSAPPSVSHGARRKEYRDDDDIADYDGCQTGFLPQ